MKVIVRGTTESTLTLNEIGVPIRGRVEAILDVNTEEQDREISSLVAAGLLEILDKPKKKTKKTRGRPKGSKNKNEREKTIHVEQKKILDAEAETQQEGSSVVIGIGGDTVKGKMTRTAVGDLPESDNTKKSLEAMEKLEEEENEENEENEDGFDIENPIDEDSLDPSEQMGRKAVIGTGGSEQKVKMVNSVVPEVDAIKQLDPFIDREDKKEQLDAAKSQEKTVEAKTQKESLETPRGKKETFIDTSGKGDNKGDN